MAYGTDYAGHGAPGGALTSFPPGGHVVPPFYADFLRDRLYPNLYMRQLGTKVTIPRGYGDKIKIPRWDGPVRAISGALTGVAGLNGSVTAITETITAGKVISTFGLSAESITGRTRQFAGARAYSDRLVLTVFANWAEGALESLGREMTFRLDRYSLRNITASGFLKTSDGGTAVTTGVGGRLKGKTIARIAPVMDARHVPRWEDESFILVTNPLAQYDVYSDPSATGFTPVVRYNDAARIYRGEIGNMYGVRMLLSTQIQIVKSTSQAATGTNGLHTGVTGAVGLVIGPDSFYCVEQEGGGVEVIHHPLGSGGATGDPANQRGSLAIKVHFGIVAAPAADHRLMRFAHEISLKA